MLHDADSRNDGAEIRNNIFDCKKISTPSLGVCVLHVMQANSAWYNTMMEPKSQGAEVGNLFGP
jgi:hypothetical protein